MNVSVIQIVVPPGATDPREVVVVRVLLSVDDEEAWHDFTVRPFAVGGDIRRLVQPDPALYGRFRTQQTTVHRVSKLVGQAVEHGSVHLPQRIAA